MTFDWNNPYPSYRTPLMARNAVATSHPLATQAGLRMLMRGGSAVDAAIATAAALTVVEPCSNGLGSDAFAIVADGGQLHGLSACGLSPAAWSAQHFDAKYGPGAAMPKRGWDSVTVPGAVSAWVALHERFGRLPFADLLEPAIELAERGHAVKRTHPLGAPASRSLLGSTCAAVRAAAAASRSARALASMPASAASMVWRMPISSM
jgi:gamma-glutamyltranspeptidase/glutathione hydrolase